MNEPTNVPGLTNEDVVETVAKWTRESIFREKSFPYAMTIEEVWAKSSYTIGLKSQYEDRQTILTSTPFRGGAVDDRGLAPSPWDVPVRIPSQFEDRVETIPVPHTERVKACLACQQEGRVRCEKCGAFGRITCTNCSGTGLRNTQEHRSEFDPNTNTTVQRAVTVQIPCGCLQGQVICPTCGGGGTVICSGCEGAGKIKEFQKLTVTFRQEGKQAVADHPGGPGQLIAQAKGARIADVEQPRIDTPPSDLPTDALERAQILLDRSHQLEPTTRLLFQRLVVDKVPVHKVVYTYKRSDRKSLWIYGEEKAVHAPDAPSAWGKILTIVLGIVGGIGGLAGLLKLLVG